MKTKLFALATLTIFAFSSNYAQLFNKKSERKAGMIEYETNDISEDVMTLKKKARKGISPYRYDASKVTYFIYKTFDQRKEVEVYFFNNSEYKVSFSAKAETPVRVEIWDKPAKYQNRTMMYSQDNLSDSFEITSTELINKLREKKIANGMSETEANSLNLKKAYVNYIIPGKEKEVKEGEEGQKIIVRTKGAMIMVMGYKNI